MLKMKERKKIKRIRIDVLLTEDRYNKLMLICGDFKTITEGIAESIDWKYGSLFPDKIKKEQNISTLNSYNSKPIKEEPIIDEAIELERMKAERRARKACVSNG